MWHHIPTSPEVETETHPFQDSQPSEQQVLFPGGDHQDTTAQTQTQTQAGQVENGRRTPMELMSPALGSPLAQEQAYFNTQIQNDTSAPAATATATAPIPDSTRAQSQLSMLHQQQPIDRTPEKQASRTTQPHAQPATNGSGNESAPGTSGGSERASSRQGSVSSRFGSMTRRFSQLASGGGGGGKKSRGGGKGPSIGTLSED